MAMKRTMNIKLPDALRTRAEACASLIGATFPEFVRESMRDKCAAVERLHGQRERAHKAAAKAQQAEGQTEGKD